MQNNEGLMPHTQKLLKSGAVFEVLWKATNGETEEQIREKEQYYINKYILDGYDIQNGKLEVYIPGKRPVIRKIRSIKVLKSDYEKALSVLEENGIIPA